MATRGRCSKRQHLRSTFVDKWAGSSWATPNESGRTIGPRRDRLLGSIVVGITAASPFERSAAQVRQFMRMKSDSLSLAGLLKNREA